MIKAPTHCRSCNGRLEEGHIVDRGYGAYHAARWQPGAPEKLWHGSIRTRSKAFRTVKAYRCNGCGLLEYYAL